MGCGTHLTTNQDFQHKNDPMSGSDSNSVKCSELEREEPDTCLCSPDRRPASWDGLAQKVSGGGASKYYSKFIITNP